MGSMELLEKVGLVSKKKERWVPHWKRIVMLIVGLPLGVVIVMMLVALLRTAIITHDGVRVPEALRIDKFDVIGKELMRQRAERFGAALRLQTISLEPGLQEYGALLAMHVFLQQSFPHIHASKFIKREYINKYSLLYTVEGSVEGKLPYLFAAHLDVVPANPAAWEAPPFSGRIVNDTYIYGRGAIDDKVGVMGVMEALEHLLLTGQRPLRTFYLAFGHDEEIGGRTGAHVIANSLRDRGVNRLEFVLDEGFPMTIGMISQTDQQIAMIGVSEKGSANIELSVTGTPGHSSFPPKESSIGILGAAVAKLEAKPQPAQLDTTRVDMFGYLIPYMNFADKFLFTNLWLFSGIVISDLETMSYTNAMIRTSTAVTIFHAGIKSNVVPPLATAVINHRVNPSQTVAEAIAYDRKIIDDDRVKIKILESKEAMPVSPHTDDDDIPFQLVAASIKQVYTDAIVVPAVLIGNTDARWYSGLTDSIFRYIPVIVATPEDSLRYHGNNERISIEHYHKAVNFYYRIIKNADLLIDDVDSIEDRS